MLLFSIKINSTLQLQLLPKNIFNNYLAYSSKPNDSVPNEVEWRKTKVND